MTKYIDADRLRAMITKYESTAENAYNPSNEDADYWHGKVVACEDIFDIIVWLQQEQPEVDIVTEYDEQFYSDPVYGKLANRNAGIAIARHFYELGQKDAANKFDEIEYNSQRAEEEMSNKTLDGAAEEYAFNNWEDNDYHTGASEGLHFDAIGHTANCFKAGAKWMAGQGVTKEAVIGMATKDIEINVSQRTLDALGLCPGDKVIVQIRKKED